MKQKVENLKRENEILYKNIMERKNSQNSHLSNLSRIKNNQSENASISVEKIIGNTAEFINKKKAICIRGIRNIDDLK